MKSLSKVSAIAQTVVAEAQELNEELQLGLSLPLADAILRDLETDVERLRIELNKSLAPRAKEPPK